MFPFDFDKDRFLFSSRPEVWFPSQPYLLVQTHEMSGSASPSDPLFVNSQWHINGSPHDISVQGVWNDYTGTGVTIGFIDDGIEYTHPELDAQYDASLDYDLQSNTNDGGPKTNSDKHGTTTAGTAVAENNGSGVVGVAYGADITSFRVNFGGVITDAGLANLFNRQTQVDVSNNSWGSTALFGDNFDTNLTQTAAAIESAATNGRGGLGTNIVFSAGNGREAGDNTNYHNLTNSPYTITVAGTDQNGDIASFSTPGASILVSAPGVAIATTDRVGSKGYVSGDYVSISGTSFSAPIVSGLVALMLEANPNLGYRDVQEILAYSARLTGGGGSWTYNDAANWNGGGLHFSHDFGFGLVDAHAAVRLAETWNHVSNFTNLQIVDSGVSSPNAPIPDGNANGTSKSLNVTSDIVIDRVQVDLSITHTWIGDLKVVLTSPDGTESVLVNRPGLNPSASSGYGSSADNIQFTMTSNAFWGESGDGIWTVTVSDLEGLYTGTLSSWSIRLFGDAVTADQTYVYTNEYGALAGQPGRSSLSDSGGVDTINAAAVTSDTVLSLLPGTVSTIAGAALSVDPGTLIEHAWLGDGNDSVTGNNANNALYGMRGNDTLVGSMGTDTLDGGIGADIVSYEGFAGSLTANLFTQQTQLNAVLKDMLVAIEGITGGEGNDRLYGNHEANILLGMGGDDIISGYGGADTLEGGTGFDLLSYSASAAGVTVNFFTNSAFGGQAQGDKISSFEGVIGGKGHDRLYGNNEANILTGLEGDDIISGYGGADTLSGGAGRDLLSYSGSGAGVTVNLLTNIVFGGQAQGDSISGFEDVAGGKGNDVLTGDANANKLSGLEGSDILTGGAGADSLTGGSGADWFTYVALMDSTAFQSDLITDFVKTQDKFNLAGLGFTGISEGAAVGSVLGFIRGGGQTIITNTADFKIMLTGEHLLSDSDFIFA